MSSALCMACCLSCDFCPMEILLPSLQAQQLGHHRTIDTQCLDLSLFLEHTSIAVPSFPVRSNLWKALPARPHTKMHTCQLTVHNAYLTLASRTWTWSLSLPSAAFSCIMEENSGIQTQSPAVVFVADLLCAQQILLLQTLLNWLWPFSHSVCLLQFSQLYTYSLPQSTGNTV